MPVVVFCLFLVFQNISTIRSPNATKLFGDFFLDIRDPGSFGRGREEGAVAHEAPRRAQGGGARPGGSWPPPLSSGLLPKLLVSLMYRKKISKKFHGIWTSFGTDTSPTYL